MASQQATDILRLAKEGNPKAIVALINRRLKSRGINAKAAVKGDRLELLLESKTVIDQQSVTEFIGKGLTSINPYGISKTRYDNSRTVNTYLFSGLAWFIHSSIICPLFFVMLVKLLWNQVEELSSLRLV